MELISTSVPIILSFIFIFIVIKQLNIVGKTPKKLPPGPWKLPLIGNIHQLNGPLPHHTLRKLAQKYGPLLHLKLGEVSTVVISSPEIAKQALKDHDLIFAHRPFFLAAGIMSYDSKGILLTPYGAYWRQMRRICDTELLNQRRVLSFRAIREQEVFSLVKSISKDVGNPVNLSKKIYSLAFDIMARASLGGKCNDQEDFIEVVEVSLALVAGFALADMYPSVKLIQKFSGTRRKLEKLHKRMDLILQNIINDHREKDQNAEPGDLVDVLLRIQKEGILEFSLTDDNIKAILVDIYGGGSDTPSTTIEWAMSAMIKNPPIMQKAQAEVRQVYRKDRNVMEARLDELEYLNSIVKETLRLYPPAPLLTPKQNSEECEINGFRIPAKSKVIVNAWAIGRDPKHWTEPEKFNPERFLESGIDFRGRDFKYIPFGAGRRICPGISFALPGVKLALAQLLFHFNWKLANGTKVEELDMEEHFGLTVKRKNDLILVPTLEQSY